MSITVLEIGYGSDPALKEGSLFTQPDVNYIGLELPLSFRGSFVYKKNASEFSAVEASADAMPFPNECFDYVLMRSVYGQFKSQPAIVNAVRMGIYECMRVLKPGGKIVISEENTPRDQHYIGCELRAAGFVIEATAYMADGDWSDTREDDEYKNIRSPFYSSQPLESAHSYFGPPNITIGVRPADIEFETFEAQQILNFYKERPTLDDWVVRKMTFQVPKRNR